MSIRIRNFALSLGLASALGALAPGCNEVALRPPAPETPTTPGGRDPIVIGVFTPTLTPGGLTNTFHHPQEIGGVRALDAREVLSRMAEEGPPAYRARVHGCRKMRYGTLGRMLADLGVDTQSTTDRSAGRMWREADQALGAPNYGARIPETTELTTASASRLFDILVQAAPEIITAMPTLPRCTIGERGTELFDAEGACTADGVSCLLGEPATTEHVELCTLLAARATTPEKGRVIAVASMLAAAATCE